MHKGSTLPNDIPDPDYGTGGVGVCVVWRMAIGLQFLKSFEWSATLFDLFKDLEMVLFPQPRPSEV